MFLPWPNSKISSIKLIKDHINCSFIAANCGTQLSCMANHTQPQISLYSYPIKSKLFNPADLLFFIMSFQYMLMRLLAFIVSLINRWAYLINDGSVQQKEGSNMKQSMQKSECQMSNIYDRPRLSLHVEVQLQRLLPPPLRLMSTPFLRPLTEAECTISSYSSS